MRWARHIPLWGRVEACTDYRWGNLRERHLSEDQGIDERIILRLNFRKWDGGTRNGLIWLRIGRGGVEKNI